MAVARQKLKTNDSEMEKDASRAFFKRQEGNVHDFKISYLFFKKLFIWYFRSTKVEILSVI